MEEIEKKSNRDKDTNKIPKDIPKIQEKLEESKNMVQKSPQNENYPKEDGIAKNTPPAPVEVKAPVQAEQPVQPPQPVQTRQDPYQGYTLQKKEVTRQPEPESQLRNTAQNTTIQEKSYVDPNQLPQNMIPNYSHSEQAMRAKFHQSQMQANRGMPQMMAGQPQPQFYSRPANTSPPIHMMAQPRQQVLPTLQNLQPMMQAGYPYGVRTAHSYVPMSMQQKPPQQRMPTSGQLPKLNQLAGLFNAGTFNQQQTQQQLPPQFMQQAQLKNLIMNSQAQQRAGYNYQNQARQPQGGNWPNGQYNPYHQK